jgi:A/G-specific adenine glycosylase
MARTPSFAARVIAWQARHGRHDLPWQNTRDPYRIWVSEIMLQQTQVAAVIGYYARFMQRFPDLVILARASQDEVMRHWAGLGYYSRARNLHKAARLIREQWHGAMPRTARELETLPGIGRSTAAAIAVFAYGERAAILDGNVKRVVARCFGVGGYPGDKKVEEALWERVSGLLPRTRTESYTQGLMDLGATLCTRSNPRCTICPLQTGCIAYRDGRVEELPHRKPKKALPHRSCVMIVLRTDHSVLLEKRPSNGIWGGLWCLPQFDTEVQARRWAVEAGIDWHGARMLDPIEHGFTHYHLTILPVVVATARRGAKRRAQLPVHEREGIWLTWQDIGGAALPAPVKKLLLTLGWAN